MDKLPLFIFSFLCCSAILPAQEVPKVFHFSSRDYAAQNQNWDIAQSADYQIYVGNSAGLLAYDGARWDLLKTPAGQAIRAVETGKDGRIFVGGYATLGYWQPDGKGKLAYHSMLEKINDGRVGQEEIWHILPLKDGVLFQSFSAIYKYDYENITPLLPPGNVMFARENGSKIILPVLDQGLFECLPDGTFRMIPGSGIFKNSKVTAILPMAGSAFLVCTQDEGIFRFSDGQFSSWQTPINAAAKAWQLNKAIPLQNGNLVFGTILSGLYITDAEGNIIHHVNQENGLQNNTVLALFEDKNNLLWVGLDKGIDLLDLNSPVLYFQDKRGEIGTVYAATIFDGKLFIGSNQGLFFKRFPSGNNEKFSLVPGTQGQVWDLQVFDNQLVGAHNSGTFILKNGRATFIFDQTGSFNTQPCPTLPDVLVQGVYTGIGILKKDQNGQWFFANRLEGFSFPARKTLFDKQGRVWALHPQRGLYRITPDERWEQAVEVLSFGKKDGLPTDFRLGLFQLGGAVFVQSDSLFFQFDEATRRFQQVQKIAGTDVSSGYFKIIPGQNDEWFKVFPDRIERVSSAGRDTFPVTLLPDNERIVHMGEAGYLFCFDDGYGLLDRRQIEKTASPTQPPPLISKVAVNGQLVFNALSAMAQPWPFKASENQLRFYFSQPCPTCPGNLRYRLKGFDDDWSPWGNATMKEFTNLPPGSYEFQVQAGFSSKTTSFFFEIAPRWYQTVWAGLATLLLLAGLGWLLLKLHDRQLGRQEQILRTEKEREIEQHRTLAKTEMLQSEILNKTRKLADTTMNLVRKNEMLLKIKEELHELNQKKEAENPTKAITKIEHLIDSHLTSEDDWKVFESNFNQLHDQFFKRLKDQFPDLTPGDLRLAAYLKMNISSKEIAPLLNISIRGVENKRYRLRSKMGLGNEVNLTEFLMQF